MLVDVGMESLLQDEQTPSCLEPVFIAPVVETGHQLPVDHHGCISSFKTQRSPNPHALDPPSRCKTMTWPHDGAVCVRNGRMWLLLLRRCTEEVRWFQWHHLFTESSFLLVPQSRGGGWAGGNLSETNIHYSSLDRKQRQREI